MPPAKNSSPRFLKRAQPLRLEAPPFSLSRKAQNFRKRALLLSRLLFFLPPQKRSSPPTFSNSSRRSFSGKARPPRSSFSTFPTTPPSSTRFSLHWNLLTPFLLRPWTPFSSTPP